MTKLENVLSELQKKYGRETVMIASKRPILVDVPRLKTGVFAIDFSTGGGLPIGKMTMAYGARSGGKSSLFTLAVANAQKTCRKCYSYKFRCSCKKKEGLKVVWMDIERVWQNKWAKELGVNTDEIYICTPETGEEAIDIGKAVLQSGGVDIIVVDSLAAMAPSVEIEESAEKWQQGLQARLLNKMFRSWGMVGNEQYNSGKQITYLMINQLRMKIGVMYGNPETKPGGMAQDFSSSVEIKMTHGKYEMESDVPSYVRMRFQITKNKTYVSHISGAYRFWVRDFDGKKTGDTDSLEYLYDLARKNGLIEEGKNKIKFSDVETTSHKQMREKLTANDELYDLLYDSLIKVLIEGGIYECAKI